MTLDVGEQLTRQMNTLALAPQESEEEKETRRDEPDEETTIRGQPRMSEAEKNKTEENLKSLFEEYGLVYKPRARYFLRMVRSRGTTTGSRPIAKSIGG